MNKLTDKIDRNISAAMYPVSGDFYFHVYGIDSDIRDAHENEEDIGKYGNLQITKGKI